nr:hypothetical protein [Tanacetum cinerariifolium]
MDSLSMGEEHLSTILEKKSNELINSSVENLVLNPSESKDLSKDLFDIEKSLLNRDNLTISSPKFDSLLEEFSDELAHIDLIPPGINEADFDLEEDIHLVERLLYNSSPQPLKEFNSENSDALIESFSPSPILVEDSDSLIEDINLFLTPDDSMSPGIENDDYDSERDILFLKELLSNDSLSLPENESFHFDVPSSPRTPAKLKEQELLEQEQTVEEKQELLAEEHAANPSEPSPVSYFYNADYDDISTPSTSYTIHLTKSATIITNPSKPMRRIYHNHDIFYDGDDDEELFSDEVKRIQRIIEKTSFDAITPEFLITDSLESLLNRDTLIISSLKFDSLLEEFFGELAHIDLIPPGINEADFDPEEDIHLDSDSLMEKVDLFLTPNDSMPPGIENDDYDSEGDILFLKEFLNNDSLSLHENESFHFDVPSSPRPLAKPPDDGIYFEPDTGLLTAKMVGDISKHYVLIPRLLPTQPTLCPVIYTLLPFSS